MCSSGQEDPRGTFQHRKRRDFPVPKGATLMTMNEALSVAELQKQLNELKGYTIIEAV